MKSAMNYAILLAGLLSPLVQAVNMTFYEPQCGVDAAFGPFYEELLTANEDPRATSEMTDFFAPNGTLIVLSNVARGAQEIISSKQSLLPVDGSIRWNHFPNITFIASETSTMKTFELSGILQVYSGGECAVTYFSTRFTVTKNSTTGMANLQPHSGSLLNYDGFMIEGSEDPCVLL